MNYVKIQITRPTNRRVEPIDSDYAVLMTIESDHVHLLKMSATEVCEQMFIATNAPQEILTPLQWHLREKYELGLLKCDNDHINFFSMSVGDKVGVKHWIDPIFDYTFEENRCDAYGWTQTYSTSTGICASEYFAS
tara:strand:- start:7435 stop:7842 length:408 start_codon:yes stop_codon:yes gene_type:complete